MKQNEYELQIPISSSIFVASAKKCSTYRFGYVSALFVSRASTLFELGIFAFILFLLHALMRNGLRHMPVAYLILGLMLLFIGRQIFWLFWGILGFAYGMEFGARLFPGQSGVTVLLFAFVLGIAGGLGAIILQRFAFGLGGFMAGGLAFFYIANELGLNGPAFPWVSFLAGGLLGFLLTVFLFDWTLMVLSAVLGVALIFESIGVSGLWTWAAAAALFAVGVTFQAQVLSRT